MMNMTMMPTTYAIKNSDEIPLTPEEKRKQIIFTISVATGFFLIVVITIGHAAISHLRERRRLSRKMQRGVSGTSSILSKRSIPTSDGRLQLVIERKESSALVGSRVSTGSYISGTMNMPNFIPMVTVDGVMPNHMLHHGINGDPPTNNGDIEFDSIEDNDVNDTRLWMDKNTLPIPQISLNQSPLTKIV